MTIKDKFDQIPHPTHKLQQQNGGNDIVIFSVKINFNFYPSSSSKCIVLNMA